MFNTRTFMLCVAVSATFSTSVLSTSAFAARSDMAQEPHRVVHKHHLATYVKPNTASDVDRDAGLYVVKPQPQPEYFGHATGSDGAMP